LNYVWDFGSLTKEDEKEHIFSIIEAETDIFGDNKGKEKGFLKNAVYEAHKFVREHEKGGVSLRDIKRVVNIVKWAYNYCLKMKDDLKLLTEKDQVILSVLITLNICYGLRMNGGINIKTKKLVVLDMYEKIYKECIPELVKINITHYSPEKILALLDKTEQAFINELSQAQALNKDLQLIPQGIALNKPLRENIFTVFACYSTLTPLLICGKPGTSKTLCA
jgi:hypothetical protein